MEPSQHDGTSFYCAECVWQDAEMWTVNGFNGNVKYA